MVILPSLRGTFLLNRWEIDFVTTCFDQINHHKHAHILNVKVPLPDAKGAVRMKGSERLENGRCKVKM